MTPDEFVVDERAVYLPAADVLVVADLHLGRDRTSDVSLPLGERADTGDRLAGLLDRHDPGTVVFAGDVLHSFGTVPDSVPESLADLQDLVAAHDATLRVLAGNHDTMLAALVDAPVLADLRLADGTVVTHGHEIPTTQADRYVVGHEHPAIRIEGARHPCALDCEDQYDGASVLVLPAFTRLASGTVVNGLSADESMSPLVTDLESCRPIVRTADGPLPFPPLGEFRSLL